MSNISAENIKLLREKTGAGMMDCKKALVENDGDISKATSWLRKKGISTAQKKSNRDASEGLITITTSNNMASIVEINSETDFAAKDSKFKDFATEVTNYLTNNQVNDIDDLKTEFEGKRQTLIQSIGENIQLRRLVTLEVPSNGCIGAYLHSDGRLAAIISINTDNKEIAKVLPSSTEIFAA